MPIHGLWECRGHSRMHENLNEGCLHGVVGWGLSTVLSPHNHYLIIRDHLADGWSSPLVVSDEDKWLLLAVIWICW